MAESSARQSAASIYQNCVSLLNDIRQLIEVHAPRSLPNARKNDLRHVGENLEAWYEEILSIRPDEELDAILERSTYYVEKVRQGLGTIHDTLKRSELTLSYTPFLLRLLTPPLVYLLLSSPQGSTEDERIFNLKALIGSLKVLYDELADEDDIAALKATPAFGQDSFPRQFGRPLISQDHAGRGLRTSTEIVRATTDLQSQSITRKDHRLPFQPQHRSTFGTTPEDFRRKSSSAASQPQRKPVASSSNTENPRLMPRSSSLSQEFAQPPCEATRDKLMKIKTLTNYSNRGNGPSTIFPVEEVRRILLEGNTAERTFHCGCTRCYNHSKIFSDSRHFDKESLTEKFATTFALLISLYRSGLISHFQKRGKCLTDSPLERDNLKFISDLQVPTADSSHIAIDEIIRDQYMFHLRQFEVWHHSRELGPEEALPISEIQEEGRGAYGTVYSFEFLPGYAGRGYEIFEVRHTIWLFRCG